METMFALLTWNGGINMSGYLAVLSNEIMVIKMKCRMRISGHTICFSKTFKVKVQIQDNVTSAGLELKLKNTYFHNV
jgi:hypothetical protein